MRDAADGLEMFAIGAIVGAGLMYLMDPRMGPARRNFLRDKLISGINRSRRHTDRFLRDKRNRAKGLLYQMKSKGSNIASKAAERSAILRQATS